MEAAKKTIKSKVGVVVSDAMEKTIVVQVERRVLNPQFKKYMGRRKKFLVHDEKEECGLGDVVQICETRPISKRKSWKLVQILKKGLGAEIAIKE